MLLRIIDRLGRLVDMQISHHEMCVSVEALAFLKGASSCVMHDLHDLIRQGAIDPKLFSDIGVHLYSYGVSFHLTAFSVYVLCQCVLTRLELEYPFLF